MEQIHSLLKRQLRRHFGDLDSLPKEWQGLLDAVNEAYREFDADRSTLERSLDLSSQELLQANSEMRAVFQAFPDLFFRLDAEGTILDYKAGNTSDLYLPPEELLGKRIQDIPLKDVGNKFQEAIQQLKETRSLVSIEYSLSIEKREHFYEARLLPLLENQVIVIVRNITERKKAEESLRKSEHRYRSFIELTNTVAWATNADGKVVEDIPTWRKYTGQSYEEIEGYGWSKALHPDDVERALQVWKKAVETKSAYETEYRVRRHDGFYRDFLSRGTPVFKEDGSIQEWVGTCVDITERKRAEEALRESEERLKLVVEGAELGTWDQNMKTGEVVRNRRWAEMIGYTLEEIEPHTDAWKALIHPDDLPEVDRTTQDHRAGRTPFLKCEHRMRTKSGEWKWILNCGKIIERDKDGKPLRAAGTHADITERKRAEEALRESQEKYSTIVEKGNDGIIIIQDGLLKFANSTISTITGFTPEEAFEKPFVDFISPAYRELVTKMYKRRMSGEELPRRYESEILSKDGKSIPVEISASLIEYEGKPADMAIIRDITERKRAEEKLRESEERYRDLFDNASDLIQSVDEKGEFVYVNKKWKEVLGYSDEEIKKLHLTDILRKDQIPHCMELFKNVISGETLDNVEVVFVTKEGREIFVSGFVNPWMKDGKFVATRAIFRDITERKRAEQALIEAKEQAEAANRLKSEFLANMSHEIRTPMNAIIGMTGITLDTDLTKEQRESLNIVKESGYALLGLLDDILDFSKIEAGRIEFDAIDFDLRTTIEGVADTLAHRASTKGLELACIIHLGVPTLLRGDPGRLRQILMNLGGNAVKFTEKGEVVIQAELKEETVEKATILFSISDTGIGIPEHLQEKIFESFIQVDGSYTRKYGGTGLGLSISKRLIEMMDGKIGVKSQPGKGSCFWFTLTFAKQKEPKDITPTVPSDIRGMRILVVDDNRTNQTILAKMLESFGCSPEAVESGKEAIQVLKKSAHEEELFDLVLLDMHMPEINGEKTLRAIKDDPEIKDVVVIILTSIGERGDVAHLGVLGCAGYLTKPVKQSQLFDTIITVLSQKKAETKEKPTSMVTRHTIAEQKRQKVRILIAEDNPMNLKLAVTLLKKAGYRVDAVEDGRMVIEAVKRRAYDLILMDVQMPEMDGFEATKIIREMEGEAKHTPIIAMTAHAMKGDRERCLQAGMDGYISKPIITQELFDTINKWTKSQDSEKNLSPYTLHLSPSKGEKDIHSEPAGSEFTVQKPHHPEGSTLPTPTERSRSEQSRGIEPVKPIDLETALNRFGGDKEFFKEMVGEFLGYVPKQLEKLTEAVERGDAKVVEREAHSLKGAAGNLSAKPMANLALQLELLGRTKDLAEAKEKLGNLKAELKHLEEHFNQSLKEEITLKP
jgi:two-component system sensor histidine kinase/response regulator